MPPLVSAVPLVPADGVPLDGVSSEGVEVGLLHRGIGGGLLSLWELRIDRVSNSFSFIDRDRGWPCL